MDGMLTIPEECEEAPISYPPLLQFTKVEVDTFNINYQILHYDSFLVA